MFAYNIFLFLYHNGIRLASIFNAKAKFWVEGRRNWAHTIALGIQNRKPDQKLYWFHCASLGEFEQGRPLIEQIKKEYPEAFIYLTFYSPSGYKKCKDYAQADFVSYLPADGKANSTKLMELVKPDIVFFVKYEFWFHYIKAIHKQNVPLYLVSAHFRPNQWFFKWYGKPYLQYLSFFTKIFTQTTSGEALLKEFGFNNMVYAGDTRIDRTIAIAKQTFDDLVLNQFLQASPDPVFIAGSVWPKDINILVESGMPASNWRMIIVPHEISHGIITQIEGFFSENTIRYSQLKKTGQYSGERILILDTIGMLNKIYRYARIAYIGGGFGKSIHNTLEPSVYGVPVIIGPKYYKFPEAETLVNKNGFFSIRDSEGLNIIMALLQDQTVYAKAQEAIHAFFQENSGATDIIKQQVFE